MANDPKYLLLREVSHPHEVIAILRDAAQEYAESANELRSAWQDPNAGDFWQSASKMLDKAADELDTMWDRI